MINSQKAFATTREIREITERTANEFHLQEYNPRDLHNSSLPFENPLTAADHHV